MGKKLPSPRVLRTLLEYCPKSGKLAWKDRPSWLFPNDNLVREVPRASKASMWRKRHQGKPALTTTQKGYLVGYILGRKVRAHRVAWAMHYGEWPTDQLDHINGNRADNRIENLRSVSHDENMWNRKKPRNNSSGHIGVGRHSSGRWRAWLNKGNEVVFYKYFDTFEEACAARKAAETKFGFHLNHGRS